MQHQCLLKQIRLWRHKDGRSHGKEVFFQLYVWLRCFWRPTGLHLNFYLFIILFFLCRIDDNRMLKISHSENSRSLFEVETFSVQDREKMLGFPLNYVKQPVDELVGKLQQCFLSPNWTLDADCLNMSEDFSGLKYRFESSSTHPFFEVKLGAPQVSDKTQYIFNADGYAKHLLGNAFSIPVVEHLLRPLKQLYAEREYEAFMYDFPWPPHNLH